MIEDIIKKYGYISLDKFETDVARDDVKISREDFDIFKTYKINDLIPTLGEEFAQDFFYKEYCGISFLDLMTQNHTMDSFSEKILNTVENKYN